MNTLARPLTDADTFYASLLEAAKQQPPIPTFGARSAPDTFDGAYLNERLAEDDEDGESHMAVWAALLGVIVIVAVPLLLVTEPHLMATCADRLVASLQDVGRLLHAAIQSLGLAL